MRSAIGVALAVALFAQATGRPDVRLPAETAGWDNVVTTLLSVFDRADVLALGEAHGRNVDAELRLRLVRHPEFVNRVQWIVVEDARSDYGGLRQAIDLINLSSASQKLHVIVNETAGSAPNRNQFAIDAIRDRVSRGGKVLVVYGSGHVWHREGGITTALDRLLPGRTFVAEVLAPVNVRSTGREAQELDASLKALEDTVSAPERPVLILLRGTRAATLVANPFYLGQAMLSPSTTIGDLDDACVYFGR
ncbi:MAG TPA: hypothetical protein VFP91_10675 [Vicinamibacterales bacterium]|nr:hypothetical protein [Vicinamibacterales bacterium]